MIVVKNRWLPLKGFLSMTWLCFLFVRKENAWRLNGRTKRHEGTHSRQQIEWSLLFAAVLLPCAIHYHFAWWAWVLSAVAILFAGWIVYGFSNLIELCCPPYGKWYYYSCFETEAYNHENDVTYLRRRIPFWGSFRCIPNRKVKYKGGSR